jgi:hypothetical protein
MHVFALEYLLYELVRSLETLVQLTVTLQKLEEAFELEIEPSRRIV